MSRAAAQSVHTWVVCVTGLTQTEGRRSGIQLLQHALHEQCSGPQTRVLLKHWRDCMTGLAERIFNWRPPDRSPHIVIAGYSYGGYSATLLAASLGNMGFVVDKLFLIDPVWRPRARGASLLSLYRGWTISVPANVRQLWYWRQELNLPQGHKLRLLGEETEFVNEKAPPLLRTHEYIDDTAEIHRRVLAEACPGFQRQPYSE